MRNLPTPLTLSTALQPNSSLPLLSPTFSGTQTFAGDFTTGDLTGVTGDAFDSALRTDPTSAFYVRGKGGAEWGAWAGQSAADGWG